MYTMRAKEITDTSITMRNVKGNVRPRIRVLYVVGKVIDGAFRVSFGPTDQAKAKTWMDNHNKPW